MKCFVASEARITLTAGIVASLVIAFTDPGPDVAFLIAVGIAAVGLAFILGPERLQLWREMHGPREGHRGHRR